MSQNQETTKPTSDTGRDYVSFLKSVLDTLKEHNAVAFKIKLDSFEVEANFGPETENPKRLNEVTSFEEKSTLSMKDDFLQRDKELGM